ncbi:MAG: DUF2075 domain-containing protein [Xanthomonadales bacterium]|nr:DUF2075 domain-containing protein [Xanthomonadales bacterium]MBK7144884.1 DUF2075 domain-containing protein [Xanthomonadales bacterium]
MALSAEDRNRSSPVGCTSRWWYGGDLAGFLRQSPEHILGVVAASSGGSIDASQRDAWIAQILLLKTAMAESRSEGRIYLEYSVPRLGKRIDVVVIRDGIVFVVEFKVGETAFHASSLDQVWDYALDLKHFHSTSHAAWMAPLLVATEAAPASLVVQGTLHDDRLLRPLCVGRLQLAEAMRVVAAALPTADSDAALWAQGRYSPTPTIIEAARALYAGHAVETISRSDATAMNLARTSQRIDRIIADARTRGQKSICFVTGVPGAGKTLVGLDVANRHMDPGDELFSVYLSGNDPLVKVLRAALAGDHVAREAAQGRRMRKGDAVREVSAFIQNVRLFRDDCLADSGPPPEHVALFDEAQRAWNLEQTRSFMARKRRRSDFEQSEPEFLISCLDRNSDWAVVVCLVGSGQEINTGEGGIGEWLRALEQHFRDWQVYVSPQLREPQYGVVTQLDALRHCATVHDTADLHRAVSMRSFRAERLSEFVRLVLELDGAGATSLYREIAARYPLVLTRSVDRAREWLRAQARGSERYGLVASSQAQRLKPLALDVRVVIDPVHWFLKGKDDTRSSYYLEDVATEFQVQGLELDWAAVVWDGDLRRADGHWRHHRFVGNAWQQIRQPERQRYQLNAYRVLLTRARQGMVVVVPEGATQDATRSPSCYDGTYRYLASLGLHSLD